MGGGGHCPTPSHTDKKKNITFPPTICDAGDCIGCKRMKYVPDGASSLTDMIRVVFAGPLLRTRFGFENWNETPGGAPLEDMF